MDRKMTESYMMHQTEELKRDAIEKLACKGFQPVISSPLEKFKNEIIKKIEDCNCEETLNSIDQLISNVNSLSPTKRIEKTNNNKSNGMKF